jgi:hypothetical protein
MERHETKHQKPINYARRRLGALALVTGLTVTGGSLMPGVVGETVERIQGGPPIEITTPDTNEETSTDLLGITATDRLHTYSGIAQAIAREYDLKNVDYRKIEYALMSQFPDIPPDQIRVGQRFQFGLHVDGKPLIPEEGKIGYMPPDTQG